MKAHLSRHLLMPALLAIAIAPLALTAATSAHGESRDKRWEPHHRSGQPFYQERRQALHERAGIDEETRQALEEARNTHHDALQELHEEHRQRMADILGEEQREALKQAHREMREEYRTQRRQAIQDRLETLIDGWDLSDEERETLRETREAIYADIQALRERDFASRDERREAMGEMRREHQATLEALLDESQLQQLGEAMNSVDDGRAKGAGDHCHHHGPYDQGKVTSE